MNFKSFLLTLSVTINFPLFSCAQEADQIELEGAKHSEINYGFVPILSFDSDLGFKYGIVANRYFYDDTLSENKNYSENIYLRIYNTTKGSFQTQALLESDRLINKAKVFIETSYIKDGAYDFFGFNGSESLYFPAYSDTENNDFINSGFYKKERTLTRFRFDLQKYLSSKKSRLLMGYTFHQYDLSQSNSDDPTLFNKFKKWSLIEENEKEGGRIQYFSLGYVFEERNNQCYCTEGNWLEAFLVFSPFWMSNNSFIKSVISFRKYQEVKNNLVLMLRVSAQNRLTGKTPFYMLNNYLDTRLNQDGLGGAYNLRGMPRNRIATDGFLLLNFEVRKKITGFSVFKNQVNIDFSFFTDNATITQKYTYNKTFIEQDYNEIILNNHPEIFYSTGGAGFYLIMNENNVININYARSIFSKEKSTGLYIGSSFLF